MSTSRSATVNFIASGLRLAYPVCIVKRPSVNVEEKIDKIVGRRTGPKGSFASGMQLQKLATEMHRAFRHRWAPKGVYRFKTHEEADEWMNRMLAQSQIQET